VQGGRAFLYVYVVLKRFKKGGRIKEYTIGTPTLPLRTLHLFFKKRAFMKKKILVTFDHPE